MKWISKPPLGTQLDFSNPLNKGLVGFWLFNEGMGDKAYDISGKRNHGTLTSMAFPPTAASGWNPGRKGRGLQFDGVDDYVNVGNNSSLSITNAITISTQLYPTISGSNTFRAIIVKRDAVKTNYMIYLNDDAGVNQGRLAFRANENTVTNYVLPVNSWTHITVVVDKTSLNIYANGISVYSGVIAALSTSSGNVTFGRFTGDPPGEFLFQGIIDEVRIWNRALSAAEIQELYSNPYGMFL